MYEKQLKIMINGINITATTFKDLWYSSLVPSIVSKFLKKA